MGVFARHTCTYVCDRCGEKEEVEGNGTHAPMPQGWTPLLYGSDVPAALTAPADAIKPRPFLLCADCGSWLRKFLEGRKVVD